MPTSWKHSREAPLWRRLKPAQAGRVLGQCYGDSAGAEALLRAYLAERDRNKEAARFWLAVHARLAETAAAAGPLLSPSG
ncbi:hypothetical protein [Microvirga rosea]|uniref:hypothetical protein n=1 Tax=Microvirga rosea TaxID=2715425 RepID=UPI001D0AD48C|nr:hypothetical protein [Microvirga rosea]MCB8821551.1 hypothetical protein [Microvirga rosea]